MKMTKVKVINWMYFGNTEFNLSGNTAITGENGSGKTTIIDAIQYALIGSVKMVKFNSAQGDSNRTLESYVRGNVGAEGNNYLRESNTISYIAIQIESENKVDIIGIAIEYSGKIDEKRFHIKNNVISDELFITDNKYKTYSEFRSQFKEDEFTSYDTIRAYQQMITSLLGFNEDTNYFKLLTNAIRLKSVNNVNHFIRDYLLENNPINIEETKNLLNQVNKLTQEVKRNGLKRDELKRINDESYKYKLDEQEFVLTNKKITYASYKQVNNNINKKNNEVIKLRSDNEEIDEQMKTSESSIKSVNELVENITNDIKNAYPDVEKYTEKIDFLRKDVINSNEDIKFFNELIKQDINKLSTIDTNLFSELKDIDENKNSDSAETLFSKVNAFRDKRNNKLSDINISIEKHNKKQEELNKDKEVLTEDIKGLEQNIIRYPDNVTKMINILEEELSSLYNEQINIKTISHYGKISNKEWVNAIEAYLGNTRFHIVVAPKYFDKSVEIYNKHKKDVYGVKIIDAKKIDHVTEKEDTLSMFIMFTNKTARNYIYSILNRVNLAHNLEDFKKYETSITKDCVKYQNNGVTKIDPKVYKTPYIGSDAIAIQLKNKQEELKTCNENIDITLEALNNLNDKKNILENLNMYNLRETYIRSFELNKRQILELKSIEEIYNDIKKGTDYVEMETRRTELIMRKEIIERNITRLNTSKHLNLGFIKNSREILTKLKEELQKYEQQLVEFSSQLKNKLDKELSGLIIDNNFIDKLKNVEHQLDKRLIIKIKTIEDLMFNYNQSHSSHNIPKIKHIKAYNDEFNSIKNEQFKLESSLTDYQSELESLLLSDFITELRDNIETTTNIINLINKNLRSKVFGRGTKYKLEFSPSNVKELETLYNIAMQDELGGHNLLNSDKYDNNLEIVKNIINKYMDDAQKLNIDHLLDVRQYFEFDVIVDDGQDKKRLNQVLMSQSGGERQVPFYILTAAAFEQSRDTSRNNNLCIALFDEAFSNMDSQRINSMLSFFNELNIQVIVSVPGKIESIVNNVDTMLMAIKHKNGAEIHDFIKLRT